MKRYTIAGASLPVIALMLSPAHAQQAAPQSSSGDSTDSLSEIVVTARRVQERLQDVPVAITAIQGDKLQDLGVRQVIDMRQVVAGLNISAAAGRTSTPVYAMRGQRAGDTVITQDPPIAVYLDEVLLTPLAGSNLGMFDLESMQALKGPQGTLFGRNTTGGAILYTTAKPTDEFEGSVRVGYGNYDTRTGTAILNVPVSEMVRLRGAVDFTKSDGFGRVKAGSRDGHELFNRDEYNLRFTAAVDPVEWLKTMTTVYYSKAETGGAGFIMADTPRPGGAASFVFDTLGGGALSSAVARQRTYGKYDNESNAPTAGDDTSVFGVNNTLTFELSSDLTLKNIFGYRRVRYDEATDFDGSILPLLDTVNMTNADTYSEELQLQGSSLNDRLTYIAGVFYFDQSGRDGGNGTVVFGGPPGIQQGHVENTSWSGFGQLSFKLTDTLTMDAGLRYTQDDRSATITSGSGASRDALTSCNFTDANGAPLPLTDCTQHVSESFSEPSWLIGLNYKPNVDTLLYVASRHSYRSGGFNLRGNSNGLVETHFDPEKVTDLELGLKRQFDLGSSWSLQSNFAGYYQWYKDIQRNVSTVKNGVIGNVTVNAAKAHIYGAEAEFELRSGHLFSLGVNYAFTKPKYDSYPTSAPVFGVPNQPDDYSNHNFQFISKHQVNANVTLSPDIGDVGDLHLVANLYYQSKITLSEDYQNREQLIRRILPATAPFVPDDLIYGQDGYTLVNFRAELERIKGSGLSAALYVKNAFDKRYINSGVTFQDSIGADFIVYGNPRTYGGELTYKFR